VRTSAGSPRSVLAPALLLNVAAVLWGSSFVLAKGLVEDSRPLSVLAARFVLATAAMALVRPGTLRGLPRRTWLQGTGLGVCYAAALVPHYYGLRSTPASAAGFLVGTYVVLTPLVGFLVLRRRSSPLSLFGVAVTVVGLAVLSWHNADFGTGEVLCLLAAVLYACQIEATGAWSTVGAAWALTTIQMGTVAVLVGLAATVEGPDLPTTGVDWLLVGYLAVVTGAIGVGVQTWAQARLSATHASVIMSAEPLWAAVVAVLLTSETVTARLVVGGTLLLAANVVTALSSVLTGRPRGDRAPAVERRDPVDSG
jgi:drug/metabolite transporter (DMT)-like permease